MRLICIIAMGCLLAGASASLLAAEFVVTSAADSGPGSLREAIDLANETTGLDEIVFADDLGPIVLTGGQLDIADSLVIRGGQDGQLISGNGSSRIFALRSASDSLTLVNLILVDGVALATSAEFSGSCSSSTANGGAICAIGELEVYSSVIAGNVGESQRSGSGGGGIFGAQRVLVHDSLLELNATVGEALLTGGAIHARGNLSISNSILSGNSSRGEGGGVFAGSRLSVVDSEVSENSAGPGPGAASVRGSTTLNNSTISGNIGNSAAVHVLGGNLILSHATIVRNFSDFRVGGISFSKLHYDENRYHVSISGSILAENVAPLGNYWDSLRQGTVTIGNTIFGDDPERINGGNDSIIFTNDAQIRPLSDNGCAVPSGVGAMKRCARTHALVFESPARDFIKNISGIDYDQRGKGFPRWFGDGVDIGAFESHLGEVIFASDFSP